MKNLRLLRESYKLSQQKLADKLGLTQPQIHGYETGAYEPEIAVLKKFADFFNTSIDYIVGNTTICRRIESVKTFDLNQEEAALIEKYRKLNKTGRSSVINVIDALLDSEN